MRKMLSLLGLAAGLLVAVPSFGSGLVWSYDSTSVAAGAAIDSGARLVNQAEAITCYVTNADGSAARSFTVSFLADDGSTVLASPTAVSVAANTKAIVTIAPAATANGGASAISARPTRRMRFQLASGGSSAGRIVCVGG